MQITFENFIDLFKKTAELRKVVEQMQSNPKGLADIKIALKPAVEVLGKQFETSELREKYKKDLIEVITKYYSDQLNQFFKDIDTLQTLTKN